MVKLFLPEKIAIGVAVSVVAIVSKFIQSLIA